MKFFLHRSHLALSVLPLLLCSCAATSLNHTWKGPGFHGPPATKVAALTVDERGMLRQAFENRFVNQLRKRGATAVATAGMLSLGEIQQDKKAAAEKVRASGMEHLIVLKLVDASASYREYRPGGERYAEVVTGFETGYWYDYVSIGYMDLSPTYGSLTQKVALETRLYDLSTAKCLWSGITESTLTDTMDRLPEMDAIVTKVLDAMHKDGMIP